MIDYRPHLIETKRKITSSNIDYMAETTPTIEDIVGSFENISSNIILETIDDIGSLSISKTFSTANSYIADIVETDIHISRLQAVQNEANKIRETVCSMLYGSNVSLEEANAVNNRIMSKMKQGYCDNDALYYLSKILGLTGRYVNILDEHMRGILYSQYDIQQFTSDEKFNDFNVESVNNLITPISIDLNDQLTLTNYLSDNNIINNYICELYNLMIDYCEVKTLDVSSKTLLLKGINDNINSVFEEAVKAIEYVRLQSDTLNELILYKSSIVKDVFVK